LSPSEEAFEAAVVMFRIMFMGQSPWGLGC